MLFSCLGCWVNLWYNQNEKLSCFLVNFADGGFAYFKINFDFKPPKLAPNSLDRLYYHASQNYTFKTKGWAFNEVINGGWYVEKDENGNPVMKQWWDMTESILPSIVRIPILTW